MRHKDISQKPTVLPGATPNALCSLLPFFLRFVPWLGGCRGRGLRGASRPRGGATLLAGLHDAEDRTCQATRTVKTSRPTTSRAMVAESNAWSIGST